MKNTFDYESVPFDFAHCFNETCLRADQCLRRQMGLLLPLERETVLMVNHHRFLSNGENCTQFRKNESQLFARGISMLFSTLPYSKAIMIRKQLIEHFGKSLFYRFKRKECLVTPEQQQVFLKIFRDNGIVEPPVFDEMVERYG